MCFVKILASAHDAKFIFFLNGENQRTQPSWTCSVFTDRNENEMHAAYISTFDVCMRVILYRQTVWFKRNTVLEHKQAVAWTAVCFRC